MKNIVLLLSTITLVFASCQQDTPGNDAATADKIQGKYIFVRATPTHKYTTVGNSHLDLISGVMDAGNGKKGLQKFWDIAATVAGDFDFNNRLEKIITELNADNINYDAIVFPNDLQNGYAIKFDN